MTYTMFYTYAVLCDRKGLQCCSLKANPSDPIIESAILEGLYYEE